MELGQKLKDSRNKAALSQEALAERIGVSRQTISNWETGRSYPDIGSLLKLSDLYGLSLDEMLKEDKDVQEHFENLAANRRKFWQMILEVGIILELVGWLLGNQDFPTLGLVLTTIGIALLYLGIIMHLRVFDHTKEEIRYGILGLVIQLGCFLFTLWKPELTNNFLFSAVRLAGFILIWGSGVWAIDWKSTRLWLMIVLYVGVPLFSIATELQDTGSLNQDNPFMHEYRVQQVLYPEEGTGWESAKVELQLILSEHRLRIAENGEDYADIGIFTYIEPAPEQTATGIWQLIPENDPTSMYKVTVEADDRVVLSYSTDEQLQYKWLLSPIDTASVIVSTFGKTMSTSPNWYPEGTTDPEPYFGKSDVLGTAKMSISVGGLDTEALTLIEEYHHGDSVEIKEHTLPLSESGSCSMKLSTRYDGEQEYALYRIPFDGGEYRFTLTFG